MHEKICRIVQKVNKCFCSPRPPYCLLVDALAKGLNERECLEALAKRINEECTHVEKSNIKPRRVAV